jgi:hypothetical protein
MGSSRMSLDINSSSSLLAMLSRPASSLGSPSGPSAISLLSRSVMSLKLGSPYLPDSFIYSNIFL